MPPRCHGGDPFPASIRRRRSGQSDSRARQAIRRSSPGSSRPKRGKPVPQEHKVQLRRKLSIRDRRQPSTPSLTRREGREPSRDVSIDISVHFGETVSLSGLRPVDRQHRGCPRQCPGRDHNRAVQERMCPPRLPVPARSAPQRLRRVVVVPAPQQPGDPRLVAGQRRGHRRGRSAGAEKRTGRARSLEAVRGAGWSGATWLKTVGVATVSSGCVVVVIVVVLGAVIERYSFGRWVQRAQPTW